MVLIQCMLALAWAKPQMSAPRDFVGPDQSQVDLLRPIEGGSRIFVQAEFPDGSLGLFLIDSGADISVLSQETADRVGIDGLKQGEVWGLSGSARVGFGELRSLRIGDMMVPEIEVAVGVPGFQNRIGYMHIDGLLGNNVWSRFTVEIDYPADTMVLHAPDSVDLPRSARPMFFDGFHVFTRIDVTTKGESSDPVAIIAQVDTGASELTLCAATGLPFKNDYTQGLETVRGIGASETLPPFRFLEMTRRIPLQMVDMGGAEVGVDLPARWMAYENTATTTCGGGMKALIGHEYLSHHRVWFDYQGGRMALKKSKRPARLLNGHAVLLEQELAAHGSDPDRGLRRAQLLLGSGRDDEAVAELEAYVQGGGSDVAEVAEARVLLAQLMRHLGNHDEAWALLDGMDPGDLIDQDQLVGTVNGLLFEGRVDDAMAIAQAGVAARPDEGWAHVALADVMLHLGHHDRAHAELLDAARLEQYSDAHLLRRARVALATGDRYGSMAHVRKLLELYPGGGPYLWFYAMLIQGDSDAQTFRSDLEGAMARLHPHSRPFDFLVAAHAILGDDEEVDHWRGEGMAQHCEPMPAGPERGNCTAWYSALAVRDLDEALALIDGALKTTGDRADFLDTKAMVHLSRGELDQARAAAEHAARMSPDDVYMLWQAERIAQVAVDRQPRATLDR